MVSRLRSTVVVCAVLILGGAVDGRGGTPAPLVTPFRIGPSQRAEVDAEPMRPLLARRLRVKRRRVWGPLLVQTRPNTPGSHRPLRSPAADRLRGGRARARALVSDGVARGRQPVAQFARLGPSSIWCTSVPPPGRHPTRSA